VEEAALGTDPLDPDTDDDLVTDDVDDFPLNPDEQTDTDGDGLGDNFELTYFGDISSSQGPADDPDGDGFTNLEEFLSGTNPTVPDVVPASSAIGLVLLAALVIVVAKGRAFAPTISG
jgi:hypothetical protein